MPESYLDHFEKADPKIKKIVKKILQIEKEKISQERPHLNNDIVNIIKDVVK